MFYKGQIVWDCTENRPCVAYLSSSHRETHFLQCGKEGPCIVVPRNQNQILVGSDNREYVIALPKTIEEARSLILQARIFPAPLPEDHCSKCFNWFSNHSGDGSCFKPTPEKARRKFLKSQGLI